LAVFFLTVDSFPLSVEPFQESLFQNFCRNRPEHRAPVEVSAVAQAALLVSAAIPVLVGVEINC